MASSSSRSLRWSASSSRGRGGWEMERLTAPVPYRVGPYDYSPAVKCLCNRKAPWWTLWSDDNLGWRYYRCPSRLKLGDCGYYAWIDRQTTKYERILLCDLRDAVWQLRKEKTKEQQQVQRVQEENGHLRQLIVQLEKKKDDLKKKMEEKEQLEIMENNNFTCFRRCIEVFALLGLLFVLKYSTM
ncbi:hypothetical protein PVAP13_2NG221300 [Panicum virgatum]|uniref:Zinc finger GRF-type domain-containing protein n=1 Tax=Panicum virgatum TaxID=38727 RepID=A0A8T0VHY9_PANVG|nr:hypothetical protein PVAP13_2NG221300 [Panicum virgatum]